MMSDFVKRINAYTRVSKDKKLEADLILYALNVLFSLSTNYFGTCFTAYDYKVALLLRRLITLVTKELHEDLSLDYKDSINHYLTILHRTSNHIDTVYSMPQKID